MSIFTTLAQLIRIKDSGPATHAQDDPTAAGALLRLLAVALRSEGFAPVEEPGRLRLPSGITLQVEHLDTVELLHGNVRTATRIIASHTTCFPQGLPEFQHSVSKTIKNALSDGFANWARMDLVTLEDCLRDKPEDCTFMDMDIPLSEGEKCGTRRVVFGPTAHLAPPTAKTRDRNQDHSQCQAEHAFCPCCLFTQNFEAFRSVVQSDQTLGIRLFASRGNGDEISADCRINGEDFLEGAEHLKAYVRSWPKLDGIEFRKQYVVVRSVAVPQAAVSAAPDPF